ncbi:hypothetical protein ACLOJK_024005 [Asimina triloba]
MERINGKIAAFFVFVFAAAIAIEIDKVGAQIICKMPVADLLDCKKAVTGANPPDPTPKCCSAISKGDLTCLCTNYKGLMKSYGIDPKLAMALPAKCGVSPPSKC